MEVDDLKHNAEVIRKCYSKNADGTTTCLRDFEVYLPKRFVDNGMAVVGETVQTAAVLGVVIPGECYAPLVGLVDLTLLPLSIREVTIKGDQYLVLEFVKGDPFIESLEVLEDPNKPYQYFLEFKFYAKRPWYLSKKEISSMFDNAKWECGSQVGSSPQVMRTFDSLTFRDPDNLDAAYRYSKAMQEGRPPVIVGLNNSSMLIDGTFAKLTGGYLQDNTLAAIVNPDKKVTDMEKIIKGVPE